VPDRTAPPPAVPLATYRLQLGPDLGFAAAAALVEHLVTLGVSHYYLSPVLEARPGSTHGYDVADPGRVAAVLGGEEGLRALARTAHDAGLGVVVDVVPNHLGTGADTPLWRDLLAGGQAGGSGRVFDVDWSSPLPGAAGKVVLPVLGGAYGKVLARGELQLAERDDRLEIVYFEHRFPLTADSVEAVGRAGGPHELRGTPGRPETWSRLHALLEQQHYRLVHWRAGEGLLNYRRFFSIDELAAVRVEDDGVFDRTHGTLLRLVAEGVLDGLRIDHPDGLWDPARYLERLAARTGGVWTVVEKITSRADPERPELLREWPVAGTTGYEFTNDAVALFVDPAATPVLDDLDLAMGGDERPYAAQVEAAKREVLAGELRPDLRRLARALWVEVQEHLEVRDTDDLACAAALTDVLVHLDVYRTYVDPETGEGSAEDEARVDAAVAAARAGGAGGVGRGAAVPDALYDHLGDVLSGRAATSAAALEVLGRAQQLSGALTAKGVEDTVFYRYRRLVAVNEVGGEPGHLGLDVAAFHRRNAARPPSGMVTTATHDTKRGEDTRLRIAALSEMAPRWAAAVRAWWADHQRFVTDTPSGPAPDAPTAHLLYQTLVGVWPVGTGGRSGAPTADLAPRVRAYLEKAGREAGQRTSWRDPDATFEEGVARFVDAVLTDEGAVAAIGAVAEEAARTAVVSGLAQVLLRCTVPGVPDTYQGTETWDLALVDPDNRRPVEVASMAALVASADTAGPGALLVAPWDGRVKALVLARALRARRDEAPAVGPDSGYLPLEVEGPLAPHVVAFARTDPSGEARLVVVAPRLPGAVLDRTGNATGSAWSGHRVTVPGARGWVDAFTGATHAGADLELSDVLAALPVALLGRA